MTLLFLFSLPIMAQDNVKLLAEATKKQEKALLEKHRTLSSHWLEKSCLQLAQELEFNKINQCNFIESSQINAYVLANGHVYFTLSLMHQIKNKHQWAAIIAHENAHLELDHYIKTLEKYQNPDLFFPKSKIKKMMREHEKQADDWSSNKLKEKGFDDEQIYFFLKRVESIKGNQKSNSHIQLSKRIKKSDNFEIIDEDLIDAIDSLNSE